LNKLQVSQVTGSSIDQLQNRVSLVGFPVVEFTLFDKRWDQQTNH